MSRLWELERAKVLAIFLVVSGHIFGREPPISGEWWYIPESYIYLFHMPLFMFLSGFVFTLKGYHQISTTNYRRYFTSRAERLLLPFLTMGLIIVLVKTFASTMFGMGLSDRGLLDSLLGIFEITESPVRFIWYLFIVFVFSVLTPVLYGYLRIPFFIITILAFLLFFAPLPDFLYASYFRKFYFFFLIGGIAGLHINAFFAFLDRYKAGIYSVFFAVSIMFIILFWSLRTFFADPFWILIASAAAIPAVIAFSRSSWAQEQIWWTRLSAYVFSIYLFNVPFIGLCKEIMKRVVPYSSEYMLFYAPLLVAAGFIGPIILRQLILQRSSYLRKMTA